LALNNTENNRNKAKNQTSLLGLALPIYHILGIFFLRLPCLGRVGFDSSGIEGRESGFMLSGDIAGIRHSPLHQQSTPTVHLADSAGKCK